ncbi:LysM peptidoglycan-binding domain-containing protein [Saccharopolyspora sp. MS10]|uniref:LysM peptidoglycan-binding domain-containing protein n=1 Tax=Saccharopolyspora sp. MS10 TaxID=3385973 RepID=UPI00399F6C90
MSRVVAKGPKREVLVVVMSGPGVRGGSGAGTMGVPSAGRGAAVPGGARARCVAPAAPAAERARPGRFAAVRECAWLAGVGLCAFVGVFLFGVLALDSGERPVPEGTAVVRVVEGDTLWSVAARFAPDSDQRAVVDRIVELNRLDGEASGSGRALVVPEQRG